VDRLKYRVDISQYVVIPESQHPISEPAQKSSSLLIVSFLIGMLSAIDFDHQLGVQAKEVDDVRLDGLLPPKLRPGESAIAQVVPKDILGIRLIFPQ
jgi:hypothetical protein